MQKIEALKNYLAEKTDIAADAITAQLKSMVLKPQGSDEGNQVLIYSLSYQAVLSLIGFPYQIAEIARFNVHLMTWLADQDDRDNLEHAFPNITLELQDAHTANLELNLAFEEEVYITPSVEGEIEYGGQMWVLGTAEMDLALTAEVSASLAN
jgi:hypothetical protein